VRVRHGAAALLAPTALFRALLHGRVAVRETITALRAGFADIRANTAVLRVIIAHPEHEIGARDASLGAISQRALVLGRGVLTAHHQAVDRSFVADCVTAQTVPDAFTHFRGHLVHVGHELSFGSCGRGRIPPARSQSKGTVQDVRL